MVNISSVAGVMGGGLMCKGAYAAAKAGVIGLTKVLAREVGEFGVNVNCIAPGMHFTPLVKELNSDEGARDTIQRIIDTLPPTYSRRSGGSCTALPLPGLRTMP